MKAVKKTIKNTVKSAATRKPQKKLAFKISVKSPISKKIPLKKTLPIQNARKNSQPKKDVKQNVKRNITPQNKIAPKKTVPKRQESVVPKPLKPITPISMEKETQEPVMNDESEMLVGTLHEPVKRTRTLVILVHGFLAHRNQTLLRETATALSRKGYAAYRFDFSGNGDSEGRFEDAVPGKMLRELDSVVRHFKDRYTKIFLLGHCLGGTIALLTAARSALKVDGLILLAAPVHLDKAGERLLTSQQRSQIQSVGFTIMNVQRPVGMIPYTVTDRFVGEMAAIDTLVVAENVTCPALLVHGTADPLVPASDSQELFEALSTKDIVLIGGADHDLRVPEHRDAVISNVLAWMKRHA
jgi:alpha-beta hydrolase superfamily lysophospholipase